MSELARILALPRRRIVESELSDLADSLTSELRTEIGEQRLWPIQALALHEARKCGGLYAEIPVGGGKTLLTWLLPVVLQAQRPLLLIPGGHRQKTYADHGLLQRHWRSPPRVLRVESYEQLYREDSATLLDDYEPDLIIADETHRLRSKGSSARKRIKRYLAAREKAGRRVSFCAFSATCYRKYLADFAHLTDWALGTGSPLPRSYMDLETWEEVLGKDCLIPRDTSALWAFVAPEDQRATKTSTLRAALGRRMRETPGFISWDQYQCDQPLRWQWLVPPADPKLDQEFETLRQLQELPDGHPISDALSLWRATSTLSAGLYERWDPLPPDSWLLPRKTWARFVRDTIKRSTNSARPLDTEAQVARVYKDSLELRAWRAVQESFTPRTKSEWCSDSIVDFVKKWLREKEQPTIVWVGHVEIGKRLARETGYKYYQHQGLAQDGSSILQAEGKQHVICSQHAMRDGYNLQAWSENLIVTPVSSGERLEQIIGRTHRAGQTRPVTIMYLISSGEALHELDKAIEESLRVRELKKLEYKILSAKIDEIPILPTTPRFASWPENEE